jgi:hypothetical protein
LERAGEENSSPPRCDDADDAGRYEAEPRGLEDSLVEADDGDLKEGTEDKVGELVRQEDLRKWSAAQRVGSRRIFYLSKVQQSFCVEVLSVAAIATDSAPSILKSTFALAVICF